MSRMPKYLLRRSYLCKTCGERVGPTECHEHNCPLEPGDKCGARGCNETGMCQA